MNERTKEDFRKFYDILDIIGHGGYGYVYKGIEKKTKEIRAIKVIDLRKIKDNLLSQFETEDFEDQLHKIINGLINEYENMKICANNNINSVKCYEYFNTEDNFVIIMELCDTNLSKLLIERKKGFNSEEIFEILNQLNKAFKKMKENNIIHRDLKLENILIKYNEDKTYIVKLTDYGCSKKVSSISQMYCSTIVGTNIYMAPEILKGEKYNYKCDLWSIGVIIYKLFFIKPPFSGLNEIALINNIEKFGNKALKRTGNEELDELIKKLLEKDPAKRLNWDEYFNHPFFKIKKINLVYETNEDNIENIFGEKFVENNKKNIELSINGIKSDLISKCKLKKGKNNIIIILKSQLTNLEYMFYNCSKLKNINKLEYLSTENVNNFSHMFCWCISLSNLK